MNKLTSFIITALLLASLAGLLWECQTTPGQHATVVANLRCEYLTNPLGIDVARPRLSWVIESNKRGQKQTAYRLLVASSHDKVNKNIGDLWDSGRVINEQSQNVIYRGKSLKTLQQCFWKVMVWDKTG